MLMLQNQYHSITDGVSIKIKQAIKLTSRCIFYI